VLAEKHRKAAGCRATVGADNWHHFLPPGPWDCITATWSLEYLGEIHELLATLRGLLAPGGVLALHGSLPRGHRRAHFSVKAMPYRPISPPMVAAASRTVGLGKPLVTGTSMLPDNLAHLGHRVWLRSLAAPAGMHYACLWRWWPDGR
jgi:trans-aconitate methyltransferase